MVAFSGFYESHEPPPLVDVRGIVLPHRDGHRNGQQRWYIVHHRFVDCRHGSRRGDTDQVVARWQRPVASDVAVDMLHRVCTATEMACNGGTFARCRQYFVRHYSYLRTMLWSIKTNTE